MSLTLSFGTDSSNDIQLDQLTDLSGLQNNAAPIFSFASSLIPSLNQPVSNFPSSLNPVQFNYQSPSGSWSLGNFTFGISGGVVCTIQIFQPASTLFSYIEAFPTTIGVGLNPQTNSASAGNISGDPAKYYVMLELQLSLTANAGANVTVGEVGIQGTASTTDTYAFQFFKAVTEDTPLATALSQAFRDFVLPLHPATFQNLKVGDFLYHNFNATLNLGFGATLGLNEVYFSGNYTAAIPGAPASVPTVNFSASAAVDASVGLSTTFQYTNSFEAFLWNESSTKSHFHLYRNHETDLKFIASASVALVANPAVNVSALSLSGLATSTFPGVTGQAVGGLLGASSAQTQITNWQTDLQNKINSLLAPFQSYSASLQASIEYDHSSSMLINATFDTSQIAFPTAWAKVVSGDFQGALAQAKGGMSLDPGSGLEDFHSRISSVTFSFFGEFQAVWSSAVINNSSVVYAGNNTFDLVQVTGLDTITNINGSGTEIDVYFAAQAVQEADGTTNVTAPDLHVVLTATNNAKFGARIGQFLSFVGAGPITQQLVDQFKQVTAQRKATGTVELILGPTAYSQLKSSTRNANGSLTNEGFDQTNYDALAQAAWVADPTSANNNVPDTDNFSVNQKLDLTYGIWRIWNIISIGRDPNSGTDFPDRTQAGAVQGDAAAWLNTHFDSDPPNSIPYVLQLGSCFMNLCEHLVGVATVPPASGPAAWKALCDQLDQIIHNYLSADYLLPTAYALAELVREAGAVLSYSGPTPPAANQTSITITARFDKPTA